MISTSYSSAILKVPLEGRVLKRETNLYLFTVTAIVQEGLTQQR